MMIKRCPVSIDMELSKRVDSLRDRIIQTETEKKERDSLQQTSSKCRCKDEESHTPLIRSLGRIEKQLTVIKFQNMQKKKVEGPSSTIKMIKF